LTRAVQHRQPAGALDRGIEVRAGNFREPFHDRGGRPPIHGLDGAEPLGELRLMPEAGDRMDLDVEELVEDLDGAQAERAAAIHHHQVARLRRMAQHRVQAH